MYWFNAGTNEIRSARVDGSDVQTVVAVPTGFSYGVAIDPTGGKIYWCAGDLTGPTTRSVVRTSTGAKSRTW
jgi:hypothetical protein